MVSSQQKRTEGDRRRSQLAGIIGKRVKLPRGTAAVMAEFRFEKCHCGKPWEDETEMMTPEPEDLPFVPYCRKGRNHGADGPNVSMTDQGARAP